MIDNGSTDGTAAYLETLRRAGDARVIRNRKNIGFAMAINQGMRQAEGDYLVWLNNDTLVTPGWLDRLVACAERSPSIGAVGPVVNNEDAGPVSPDKLAAALALRNAGRSFAAPWLIGYCLLLKREAVEQAGSLDRRFRRGFYEDYDYCLRLRQAGYEIRVAQDAFVFHHWHQSFGRGPRLAQAVTANRKLFIDKWCRLALDLLCAIPSPQTHEDAGLALGARR